MKRATVLFVVFFCLSITNLWANKTSVEIKAPAEVKAGTEVTIAINVMHSGNSKAHHTAWVFLNINGKEVKRWIYDKGSLPPDGNFTLEFKYIATEALTLEAEGYCNIHGSAGMESAVIKITN
jgi:desulfoferrodoxin (superoxide reductase-like protein)